MIPDFGHIDANIRVTDTGAGIVLDVRPTRGSLGAALDAVHSTMDSAVYRSEGPHGALVRWRWASTLTWRTVDGKAGMLAYSKEVLP